MPQFNSGALGAVLVGFLCLAFFENWRSDDVNLHIASLEQSVVSASQAMKQHMDSVKSEILLEMTGRSQYQPQPQYQQPTSVVAAPLVMMDDAADKPPSPSPPPPAAAEQREQQKEELSGSATTTAVAAATTRTSRGECMGCMVPSNLPLRSVSPLVQAFSIMRVGEEGVGFDYGFYRIMYPDMRGKSNEEMERDFREKGDAAGRMRYPFYDYEKAYDAGDRDHSGRFIATMSSLLNYAVWDIRGNTSICPVCPEGIPPNKGKSCICEVVAFRFCDVSLINSGDDWRTQFLMGDKLISFGNVFMSDVFHYDHERPAQVDSIGRYIRENEQRSVIVMKEQVFSLFTPVSRFFWHVTHDLFQFLYVYVNGGYTCPVVLNYSWMNDLIRIFLPPGTPIILVEPGAPTLFRDIILVRNYHSLRQVAELSMFVYPFIERVRTPGLPTIPLAIIARNANNARAPSIFPAGNSMGSWHAALIAQAGAQELHVGSGGMSLGEQIRMMYSVKTLVTDWGSGMSNGWFMSNGSIMFVIVHPGRKSQMDPGIPLGKFMEPLGVHMYPIVVSDNGVFDVQYMLGLLRKVMQVYNEAPGFNWRKFVAELGLEDVIPMEYLALNLHLRREQWPGSESLAQVDDDRVRAQFVKLPQQK